MKKELLKQLQMEVTEAGVDLIYKNKKVGTIAKEDLEDPKPTESGQTAKQYVEDCELGWC